MDERSGGRVPEKPMILKRIGCSLVVVSLIFLLLMTASSAFYSPWLAGYAYALAGLGVCLIFINKVFEYVRLNRLSHVVVRCTNCGWSGSWTDWSRSECCPECDAEEVVLEGTRN